MKHTLSMIMVSGACAGALFLGGGCSTTRPVREIPPPQMTLRGGATVKITTVGTAPVLDRLDRVTRQIFLRNGGKIAESAPDYWVVIHASRAKRIDTAKDDEFNVIYSKEKRENQSGGEEFVAARKFTTSANAHFVSVAIYDVKTLTPIVNFDFPYYSSSFSDGRENTSLREDSAVAADYRNQLHQLLKFTSAEK